MKPKILHDCKISSHFLRYTRRVVLEPYYLPAMKNTGRILKLFVAAIVAVTVANPAFSQGGYVLPDLIVVAKRTPDKVGLTQFDKEAEGALYWKLKQHLDRELGEEAGLPFSFARGSTSNTADGAATLDDLNSAMATLKSTKKLEIIPIVFSDRDRAFEKQLTQRRLSQLKKQLVVPEGVSLDIKKPKYLPISQVFEGATNLADHWVLSIKPTIDSDQAGTFGGVNPR